MYKIDEKTSVALRNLMCICTFLILVFHLPAAIEGVDCGVLKSVVFLVRNGIANLAVPLFFAMSGFLLAQRVEQDGWYGRALRSRFWSLVIPYIAINTLLIPLLYVYHNVYHAGEWAEGGLDFNWYTISRVYGLTIHSHPASGPLWYIRCLLMFVAVSPLLVWIIRRSRSVAITWLVICAIAITFVQKQFPELTNFFYSFFSLAGIWFFSCGIALCLYGRTLSRHAKIVCLAVSLVGIVVVPSEIPGCGLVRWWCIGWLLWQFSTIPFLRFPLWFGSSLFALYAFHETIYQIYAFVMRKSPAGFTGDFGVILPLIVAIAVICAVKWLLVKYLPAVAKIILGGRS